MGRNDPTVEEILRMIARQDERALRDEQRLLSLFADYSRGKMAAQQRQLAIFCQCDGHITIQKLRGASGTDQQLGYHRLIREMVDGYGLRREVALDISGAYWRIALGTEPPETSSPRPTPPEPTPQKPQPESRPPETSTGKRGGRSPWLLVAVAVLAGAAFVFGKGIGKNTAVSSVPTTPSVSTVSTTPSTPAVSPASTRFDLTPFQLNEAVAKQIQEGTEDVYIYPDGSRMEFYFDGSGKEICRVYINTEDRIENLFTMLYDSSGRLMMQELYDSQGTALRVDTYDFHSNESTAQHRIELSDGRFFQGISTFDADGGETFECFLGDGSKTVTRYDPNGLWVVRTTYDTSGAVTDESSIDEVTPLYAVRDIPIGKAISYGELVYVWGLCGEPIKGYIVYKDDSPVASSDPTLFRLITQNSASYDVTTYDVLGNRLDQSFYNTDGVLIRYFLWEYDENGNCLGYDRTSYAKIQNGVPQEKTVTHLNQDGLEISSMTYDATGNLTSRMEYTYNSNGQPETLTTYDAEGKLTKRTERAYNSDGLTTKVSWYDAAGKLTGWRDFVYNSDGQPVKFIDYDADGTFTGWQEYIYADGRLDSIQYHEAE